MNSGSESVTVSLRIADVNAKIMTQPGGKHAGKTIKIMAIEKGFHGRTDRPAQMSHSCMSKYSKHLASFRNQRQFDLVPANDPAALEQAFVDAAANNVFIELLAIEPVQGEGNPGQCVSREFYDATRRLTLEHDSMLLVDSIQQYPRAKERFPLLTTMDLQDCDAPDWETWSKAMNAGQYPLSVLGMNKRASEPNVTGIYGNTMTTNPRALRPRWPSLTASRLRCGPTFEKSAKNSLKNSPNSRRNSHVIRKCRAPVFCAVLSSNRINSPWWGLKPSNPGADGEVWV